MKFFKYGPGIAFEWQNKAMKASSMQVKPLVQEVVLLARDRGLSAGKRKALDQRRNPANTC